jgi:protein-L-isoaspartate(D-aspartate) O-methyltransferase
MLGWTASNQIDKSSLIRYYRDAMKGKINKYYLTASILFFTWLGCTGCKPAAPTTASLPTGQSTITPLSAPPEALETLDEYAVAREDMVRDQIETRGVQDLEVLMAMRSVPRHEFVLERYLDFAYSDRPLPIDHGQTISQPFIVALMTELLGLEPGDRVLEIGTGSGYQAAVLSAMDIDTYSVEIIPQLATQASDRLNRLGYTNVDILNADGYFGWEEFGPYEAIIVTAAPDHLPQHLINQLSEGGRLVIPIGPIGAVQTLWLFEKIGGELQATNMGGVRFVPLTGEH